VSGAKLLRQVHTGNRLIDDSNRNVELFTSQARRSPFWSGNLVENLTFTGGVLQNVNHGLGRVYRGWFIVRLQAVSAVTLAEIPYNSSTPLAFSPMTWVPLETTAGCIVSLWFW
jgi:hypothetical protein